ncbi:hypothetical protein Tco_1215923 [Tanacetum coccineum]
MNVSPIPTTRIHKDHPKDQIIGDINLATQTRRMTKIYKEHAMMDVKSAFLYGTIEEEVHKKTQALQWILTKAQIRDAEAKDVDVQLYRSMIRSLLYLTASRLDIMFAVCACARFQVTPKLSHLYAVKKIFRYLKDSSFDLEAFSNSDYAEASLDRKSTTGGCQFHGKRLISWQCKKQTIVANSTTEAEYVAAANCYGHETDIQEKDKNKAKKDKTEHENEKSVKKQSKSKSQQRSQPRQSQSQLSNPKPKPKKILNGPPLPI